MIIFAKGDVIVAIWVSSYAHEEGKKRIVYLLPKSTILRRSNELYVNHYGIADKKGRIVIQLACAFKILWISINSYCYLVAYCNSFLFNSN